MKVAEHCEDFFRRRLEGGRALDAERIGLGSGEDEDDGNRDRKNDGNDDNDFEPGWLRLTNL
jgi:hypothetical protein